DRIAFETETLQGDKITSKDLFTGHKVTMINLWATWCPPCVGEMPDLEKLNATFAEQDCQIVGVCLDAREERALKEALQILEENGVTYPNVLLSGEMDWANVPAIPTSFFVGEDGTILTEPVVGAYIPGYQQALKEALGKNQ
ncbi:MAG: TlpA family protein disulfide reductase, partial [Oscillospiraceae bacterium]|nr:TlpA family protein disulfide reductase [Oscillospiraceae bacterium]